MTKSLSNSGEFDKLLLEAWEICMEDKQLAGLPMYGVLNRWLVNLTYACPRSDDALANLKAMVSAMRKNDQKAMEEVLADKSINCAQAPKANRRKELRKPLKPGEKPEKSTVEISADCNLLTALASMSNCITMQQFFREVAVHTCDRGALLMRITKDVLYDFQSFIESVFSNRVTQIAMVLGREQMTINDRYVKLEARTMNRAQLALLHVKYIMPGFIWQRFVSEKEYVKFMVVVQCADESNRLEDDFDTLEDNRGKSLLYHLNWLRTEIERAEYENHGLYEQHTEFTNQLGKIEQSIADIQCRTANEMSCMTNELGDLRAKSADQVCLIDRFMEKIQMLMHNSKVNSTMTGKSTARVRQ